MSVRWIFKLKFSQRECEIQLSVRIIQESKRSWRKHFAHRLSKILKSKISAAMVPPLGYNGFLTNLPLWATWMLECMKLIKFSWQYHVVDLSIKQNRAHIYFLFQKLKKNNKTLWLLWMGFICLKARTTLTRGSLLFTSKFPETSGTHFTDLGRMKVWITLEPSSGFEQGTPGLRIQHLDH